MTEPASTPTSRRDRPVAIVTGASRGLGFLLARELADRGHDLVINARSESGLAVAATALQEHGAQVVTVAGELKGNIENAKRVELLEGGIITGDVKAGSLTVAAGSRMRGQVEFGWDEEGKSALGTKGFGTAQ